MPPSDARELTESRNVADANTLVLLPKVVKIESLDTKYDLSEGISAVVISQNPEIISQINAAIQSNNTVKKEYAAR